MMPACVFALIYHCSLAHLPHLPNFWQCKHELCSTTYIALTDSIIFYLPSFVLLLVYSFTYAIPPFGMCFLPSFTLLLKKNTLENHSLKTNLVFTFQPHYLLVVRQWANCFTFLSFAYSSIKWEFNIYLAYLSSSCLKLGAVLWHHRLTCCWDPQSHIAVLGIKSCLPSGPASC